MNPIVPDRASRGLGLVIFACSVLTFMSLSVAAASGALAQKWVCYVAGIDGSAVRLVMKLQPDGVGGLVGPVRCFPVIGRCVAHRGAIDIALSADGSLNATLRFRNGIGCVGTGSANGAFVGAEAVGDYVCETPSGTPASGGSFDCVRRQ